MHLVAFHCLFLSNFIFVSASFNGTCHKWRAINTYTLSVSDIIYTNTIAYIQAAHGLFHFIAHRRLSRCSLCCVCVRVLPVATPSKQTPRMPKMSNFPTNAHSFDSNIIADKRTTRNCMRRKCVLCIVVPFIF